MRLFNTPEINQGCWNRGGGRGLRPLRFWQVSYPYLNQGRGGGENMSPHIFKPSHGPVNWRLSCHDKLQKTTTTAIQMHSSFGFWFGLVFCLRKPLKSMLIIIILFFKSQKQILRILGSVKFTLKSSILCNYARLNQKLFCRCFVTIKST